MHRILVAGVGNVFLHDDAFGVEVARRLMEDPPLPGVRIADFGIRRLHLAYELLEGGYDTTILIDALSQQGAPGTLYLLEPDFNAAPILEADDAHTMNPQAVFAALRSLGGAAGRVLVVGCEPFSLKQGIGLSAEVKDAVGEAVRIVRELIQSEIADAPHGDSPEYRRKWHGA